MLFIPLEHDVVLTEHFLERAWIHIAVITSFIPHLEIELGKLRYDFSLRTKRISLVDFRTKAHGEKVLSEALEIR